MKYSYLIFSVELFTLMYSNLALKRSSLWPLCHEKAYNLMEESKYEVTLLNLPSVL